MKPKIIAMYLPQFHQIPENDEFWGEGFTDWITVKKAKPLFKGHQQPRVPLNNNYYDLSIKENVEWQAKLAREHGIFGFGIYHYWFNNEKNLLTKPAEILLENKDIDINFFFAWDNANWIRSWGNVEGNSWAPSMEKEKVKRGEPIVLIPYILGEKKDWEIHYNYVSKFFADDRYIKKGNMPVFVILKYNEQIQKMCDYWEELARKDGYDGLYFIYKCTSNCGPLNNKNVFKYEPGYSGFPTPPSLPSRLFKKAVRKIGFKKGFYIYSYDEVWNKIIENTLGMPRSNCYSGAFISYDDTPRRGKRGTVVYGSTPEKFAHYLSRLLEICSNQDKDYVFLTAWNEWGEGAYLEPDSKDGMNYLQALKNVISNV